jgi:uncharacterized alkaline shock family protein YloU
MGCGSVVRNRQINIETIRIIRQIVYAVVESNIEAIGCFTIASQLTDDFISPIKKGAYFSKGVMTEISENEIELKVAVEGCLRNDLIKEAVRLQECIYRDVSSLTGFPVITVHILIRKLKPGKEKIKDA